MKRLLVSILLVAVILCLAGCQNINDLGSNSSSESTVQTSESSYKLGLEFLANNQFEEAAAIFEKLGSYMDSSKLCMYCKAVAAGEQGNYDIAISTFENMLAFKDSIYMAAYYKVRSIESLAGAEDDKWEYWLKAANEYDQITLFRDSQVRAEVCRKSAYDYASSLEASGDQDGAYTVFIALGEYSDSYDRAYKPYYQMGEEKREKKEWDEAVAAFMKAGPYSDASVQIYATRYAEGDDKREQRDWNGAVNAYTAAGEYGYASVMIDVTYYEEGVVKKNAGDWEGAGIAFDNAGFYDDSKDQAKECWYNFAAESLRIDDVNNARYGFMRAYDYLDGAEQFMSLSSKYNSRLVISHEHNVVLGLRDDGTVVATGKGWYRESPTEFYTDIVGIAAGLNHTVFLRRNGTVFTVGAYKRQSDELGNHSHTEDWTNVIAVAAGGYTTYGLRDDGTLLASQEVSGDGWSDLIAISADEDTIAGLHKDGTVIANSYNSSIGEGVKNWSDIVAISAGYDHLVGLRKDGTVLAVGKNNHNQCDTDGWRDIIAIAASYENTLGLKRNGSLVRCGTNYSNYYLGDINVGDVVSITTERTFSVVMRKDGTVFLAGKPNWYHEDDVSGWCLLSIEKKDLPDGMTIVPNLAGKTLEEAETNLKKSGLLLQLPLVPYAPGEVETVDPQKHGLIMRTSPGIGNTVVENQYVELTIYQDPSQVLVIPVRYTVPESDQTQRVRIEMRADGSDTTVYQRTFEVKPEDTNRVITTAIAIPDNRTYYAYVYINDQTNEGDKVRLYQTDSGEPLSLNKAKE